MAGRSGGSDRVRSRQSVPVVVLVALLVFAASAVVLLAVGRFGGPSAVGDRPPAPGWTVAPGPWHGTGARGNGLGFRQTQLGFRQTQLGFGQTQEVAR